MKLETLLENAALHPMRVALWKEFTELAKKYNLVWVLSSGWPRVTKDGVWFGGGLKDNRHSDEDDLPQEIRIRAFAQALAKRLGELMDEGHKINIGSGMSSNNELVDRDQLRDAVSAGLKIDFPQGSRGPRMPCITWRVHGKEGLEKTLAAVIDFYGRYDLDKPRKDSYGSLVDYAEARISVGTVFEDTKANRAKWKNLLIKVSEKYKNPKYQYGSPVLDAENDERQIKAFLKLDPVAPFDKFKRLNVISLSVYPDKKKYAAKVKIMQNDEFESWIMQNLL